MLNDWTTRTDEIICSMNDEACPSIGALCS
jgi:hypothetical protein